MKEIRIKITLTEEMLGMSPSNKDVYNDFIAKNAPDAVSREEEIELLGVEAVQAKGTTVFMRDHDDLPCLLDYQIKGFFKDAVGMLRRVPGSACSKLKAYKKEIDGMLFVKDRCNAIDLNGGALGTCQRPLRSDGPNGSVVALACSETVPAGSSILASILILRDDMEVWVRECLDYGELRGLGQWRNSGKGRFTWEEVG